MARAVSQVQGRVGGAYVGRDVRATVTERKVEGRIGGNVVGWDINLAFDSAGHLSGRVGGRVFGRDISGRFTHEWLEARVGGNVFGVDVRLQLEGNRITGRMGGRAIGNSFEVTYNERTRELTGRIGGKVDGKDVNFRLSREGKPLLAALLAGLAVYYMEVEARSRSNSG